MSNRLQLGVLFTPINTNSTSVWWMVKLKTGNMFVDLNNFLTCQSFTNSVIAISESESDSSFLIHHFLSYLLKNQNHVALLSLSQSFTHFNGVGNKIGNNLTAAKEERRFVFIEGLKLLGSSINGGSENVGPWCEKNTGHLCVKTMLSNLKSTVDSALKKNSTTVLIIDNVSVLIDIGLSTIEVCNLIQQLNQYCINHSGGLIVGVNNDLGDDDEDSAFVKKFIQHMSSLSIDVRGLETGYCKDVHGQIEVTWRNTTSRETWPVKSSQFKLTDKNCILFAPGMSSAVL